jgi:hypothetical protein
MMFVPQVAFIADQDRMSLSKRFDEMKMRPMLRLHNSGRPQCRYAASAWLVSQIFSD